MKRYVSRCPLSFCDWTSPQCKREHSAQTALAVHWAMKHWPAELVRSA